MQEMLFRVAGLPMVENCMSGYNSCMFAYGQVYLLFYCLIYHPEIGYVVLVGILHTVSVF